MAVLVANIGQLVTMAGPARARVGAEMRDLGVIEDGAMLIEDGVITAVGSYDSLSEREHDDLWDMKGRVVTPGFVDAHTHPVFAGNRVAEYEKRISGTPYEEIARQGGGIMSTVRQTRAASEEELYRQAWQYGRWFLKSGTTTVEAKSGYGLTLADEMKMLRVIRRLGQETPLRYVPTFLGAHCIPADQPDYIESVIHEMIPAVIEEGLAEWCDIFCESIACDLETTRRVLTAAKKAGLKLRMHVDQLSCSGGAELAAELGAKTADHLEMTGPSGIAALAKAGVQPVLLPGSVYALGHTRYPDVRAMIEAGLAVVLATDFNPGSSPTTSMPMILSLACTQMRMTPAEAMTAATINAACSLDRGASIGSLEVGKQADFVSWELNDYREIPYFFGENHAFGIWVGGVRVM